MFRFMGAIFSKTDLNQFMIKTHNSNLPFITHNKDDSVFLAPWQGQLFAITVHMAETGHFTWFEFTYLFGNHLKLEKLFKFNEVTLDDRYYICWLNALEELIINKKLGNKKSISIFRKKWEKAFNNTPHGKPVKIED